MSEDKHEHECGMGDEIIAGPDLSDGSRLFVRHTADHNVVGGVMRTAKEGKPCNGAELVALTKIEGDRYKVESLHDGRIECDNKPQDHHGPSTAVTNVYRNGWDRIFGSGTVGQA